MGLERIAAVMRPDNADYQHALAEVTPPDPAPGASAAPGEAGAVDPESPDRP